MPSLSDFDIINYMFTNKNMTGFTKHIFINNTTKSQHNINNKHTTTNKNKKTTNKPNDGIYRIFQKDSLFWCFYILKNSVSNYEMEISGKYFVIEKEEKFKYIQLLRNNKDKLKIHNIKPFTEIEDDLANKERISIKTFFALCIIENINILLVDKRKYYELLCNDGIVHVIHRNSTTFEHSIDFDINDNTLKTIKDTYYKVNSFAEGLKSISAYKVDDLKELCTKFNISIDNTNKKLTKKDLYELLVQYY